MKSWWKMPFLGVLISIALPVAAIGSCAVFVDWNGPADDLSAQERERAESCMLAARSLGDDIYSERPDCRAVLDPRPPAQGKAAAPRDCATRYVAPEDDDEGVGYLYAPPNCP